MSKAIADKHGVTVRAMHCAARSLGYSLTDIAAKHGCNPRTVEANTAPRIGDVSFPNSALDAARVLMAGTAPTFKNGVTTTMAKTKQTTDPVTTLRGCMVTPETLAAILSSCRDVAGGYDPARWQAVEDARAAFANAALAAAHDFAARVETKARAERIATLAATMGLDADEAGAMYEAILQKRAEKAQPGTPAK